MRNQTNYFFNALWWVAYTVFALLAQRLFPGCDALTPGFLIALQERRPWQTGWLLLFFIILQEGGGSLHFGMSVLWFSGVIAVFYLSARHFMAENIVFITFLSLILCLYQGFLLWFMAALQNIELDYIVIAQKSILQAVLVPVIWGLARLARPKALRYAHRS